MRIIYFLVALVCCCCVAGARAVDLSMLDRAVERDFTAPRFARIDSLKRRLPLPDEKWDASMRLAAEYADLNVDSALSYALRARSWAPDHLSRRKAMIRTASIYNSSLMMYKEAADIFDSLPAAGGSDSGADVDYYILGVQLYRNLELMTPVGEMRERYAAMKRAYRDSVLAIDPASLLIRANKLLDGHLPDEALHLLLAEMAGEGYSPANGAIYHVAARACEEMGDADRQMEFLALAARADLENGVREYLALPQLAQILYERGDLDRAYRYMSRSVRDATSCNARVRMLGTSEAMSIISDAYSARQREARMRLAALLVLSVLLLAALVVSLYYARQRNRLLDDARRQQEATNLELADANRRLEAAGKVREKYVRRFMNMSLGYLQKMEHYRASLFKTAAQRNFDRLYDAIRSTSYIEEESASFYRDFDRAFLELYPSFIEDLNALLRPEEKVSLSADGGLTTELRIFALMRLGITESAEIARFLHCSQSTVYNYRTRFRRKAIDTDEFIARIYSEDPNRPPTS